MASSSRFSDIYAFGDSLSDAGNDSIVTAVAGRLPVSPPYFEQSYGPLGSFTATVFSNGPVWVQDLAGALGVGAVRPSLYGGNDFAYGGAEARPTESGISGIGASLISPTTQLAQFGAGGGGPASALYTLSIGTNDVQSILKTAGLGLADQMGQVAAAVAEELSFLSALIDGGARSLLVLDVPDMSKLPVVTRHDDAATVALAGRLSNFYNVDLNEGLQGLAQTRGVDISVLPLYSLLDQAVAQPAAFGLSNVTEPAWTGDYTDPASGTVASNADTHLFWDEYHPTGTVHQLIANDAAALLATGTPLYPAPSVAMTDASTGRSSTQFAAVPGTADTGVQSQFLYPGLDSVALRATTSDALLQGGPAADALQAIGGSNVLDGGGSSNFLVGATDPAGSDLFLIDGRSAAPTWSTIVNFHPGDTAKLFGFHLGVSTLPFTGSDGVAGYAGLTIHSELDGAGTGLLTSLTFAGVDAVTAYYHFGISTATQDAGTASAIDYLQIRYNA